MESVETSGRTVDDAIENALDELGLERDEVDIEILDEGGTNLLARVRVTPRARVDDPIGTDDEYAEEEDDEIDDDAEALDDEDDEELDDDASDDDVTHWAPPSPEMEPIAEAARAALDDILHAMEMDADVVVTRAVDDEGLPTVELDVEGEYLGILIGHHGETLSALQFVTGLITSRRLSKRVRVIVDMEGYRERRSRMLRDIAMRAAERAQRYRQPIFLDPMQPAERRIVHMALQQHPYVTTHSIGEG
ncbi:MAG: RNA-binding cell elongation regulator Jag/EloR, partial [Chloroflexota bacterium]